MITDAEEKEILSRAYVPEHLVGLMTRVSGGEPYLVDDFFCCRTGDLVIAVGYPLDLDFTSARLERAINMIVETFRPGRLSLVAPELLTLLDKSCRERESDFYYTLDLPAKPVPAGLIRSAAKAMRECEVERADYLGEAHLGLAEEFVARVDPPPRVKELMFRMWNYVGQTEGSLVLNAWGPGRKLAAFYVVDVSAEAFSTYVIGCHSKKNYVMGASDLLLHELIRVSTELDKSYIHLGLGVNDGIRRFKKKWGGVPTLKYEMCEFAVRRPSFLDAIISYTMKQ